MNLNQSLISPKQIHMRPTQLNSLAGAPWATGSAALTRQDSGITIDSMPRTYYFGKAYCEDFTMFLEMQPRVVFCYWATDPFDNPDYESFIDRFYDEFSCYPKTTTAKALDDVKRTRSWLTKTFNNGLTLNRISVLSLPALRQLHREFSPEDLLCVNLLPRNNSSPAPLVNAGRVYHDLKAQERLASSGEQSTIACVTGFLISMIGRTIKLIAPCPACDQWPNGYRIYGETTFQNPDDIRPALLSLISEATQ